MPAKELFVGLMSGTCMHGIDAVLVELSDEMPRLVGHHQLPYPLGLGEQLMALCRAGDNEIDRLGGVDIQIGEAFAAASQGAPTPTSRSSRVESMLSIVNQPSPSLYPSAICSLINTADDSRDHPVETTIA